MLQHKFILSLCFLLSFALLPAQRTSNEVWKTLGLMKFERQFAESDGISQQQGRFVPVIEEMECEEIIVKGYIIPLDGKKAQKHFMFSLFPYTGCFFCGMAGAETVIEAFSKDGELIEYSDQSVTLKGYFRFTGRDPNDIMFTLEEAQLVKSK